MDVRHHSILVSNHANLELNYVDSQSAQVTLLKRVGYLFGSIVTWPFFYFSGIDGLFVYSFKYFKAKWNQYKIINVITNNQNLEKYSENRIKCCDTQIERLKAHAIYLMEIKLRKPVNLYLPIPENLRILDQLYHLLPRLPKSYRNDFPWDDFSRINFYHLANTRYNNKNTWLKLEQVRLQINFLSKQKEVLSDPDRRLEAIKKIAEMSFIKNAFLRQKSKEGIMRCFLWLLPSGEFWNRFFVSQTNARLTYEGNKKFLPAGTNLQTYDDLVDAHNKLVRNNDFIVPYIEYRNK